MKLLSSLWLIQKWIRTQKTFRLYSSSLLLVYDAKHLKSQNVNNRDSNSGSTSSPYNSLSRSSSVDSNNKLTPTSLNEQNWQNALHQHSTSETNGTNNPSNEQSYFDYNGLEMKNNSVELYKQLQRCHSIQNNYEEVTCY